MSTFFNKDKYNFLDEWNAKGEQHAKAVNDMVAFAETHGWDKWEGEDPIDQREHLAEAVLDALREANQHNEVEAFRNACPPSNIPFASILAENAQGIFDVHIIDDDKIVFITGAPSQTRQAYLLDGDLLQKLDSDIVAIGKSPLGNCFAIAGSKKITTWQGWQKAKLYEFDYPTSHSLPITQLLPFNDGSQMLLVSSEGIYHLSEAGSRLVHAIPLPEDGDSPVTKMEHAALSTDNSLICVGDLASEHKVLNSKLEPIAEIGRRTEYPHFALFSKDGAQLIMNSCYIYNGQTDGIAVKDIEGTKIAPFTPDERLTTIDNLCRIYSGVAAREYYILGDAYGYIMAFTSEGKKLWQQFIGATISSIAISEDEKTLYVGCHSGILHKLSLGKGHRDNHTMGNGNHYEEFRILLWKNEERALKW